MRDILIDLNLRNLANLLVILVLLRLALYSEGIKPILTDIQQAFYLTFYSFIDKTFGDNQSLFIASILIGITNQSLPKDIYSSFKRFNLLHAISISGANFSLIQSLIDKFNYIINKKILVLLSLIIFTLYFLLIGFNNAPALRAYINSSIINYSKLMGRPIKFQRIIFITILVTLVLRPELLFTNSFLLSQSFAIFYHLLGRKPFSTLFDSELKRILLIFLITTIIFNSQSPDFLANLLFSILYPLIFVFTFLHFILSLSSISIDLLVNIVTLIVDFIFKYFKELESSYNSQLQIIIFLAILALILKSQFRLKSYEYQKFN